MLLLLGQKYNYTHRELQYRRAVAYQILNIWGGLGKKTIIIPQRND